MECKRCRGTGKEWVSSNVMPMGFIRFVGTAVNINYDNKTMCLTCIECEGTGKTKENNES